MIGLLRGAREPTDTAHVRRYPASAVLGRPGYVKRKLRLPTWHANHNQAQTASCVGHATALILAIINGNQSGQMGLRYNPIDVWQAARLRDEWADNDDLDDVTLGTSYRAAFDHLRESGPVPVDYMRVVNGRPQAVGAKPRDHSAGVAANRWAGTLNELREAINRFIPVGFACAWRSAWDHPVRKADGSWQFPARSKWGRPGPGHAWVLYGADDDRECFLCHNSYGDVTWGHVWLPYLHVEKIMADGWWEGVIVTDR